MIKELLLLPLRIVGLVFMAIGGAIEAHQRRAAQAERLRIAQAKEEQRAAERGARIAAARAKEAERKRAAQARAEATEARRAEAERIRAARAAERVREADNDLAHLEQRQRDLATLYSFAESQYANAGTDRQKEAAYRKMMALDQQRRTAARQAERMQHIISMGGR